MTDTASIPRGDQRSDRSRSATADALRHTTRRVLLSIYPREQVADWFELHAAADPAVTAQKVLRLCGYELGTSSLRVRPPFTHLAEPSKPRRETGDLAQALLIAWKDHDERQVAGGDHTVERGDRCRPPGPIAPHPDHADAVAADLRAQETVTAVVRRMHTCEQPEEVQTLLLETVDRLGGRPTRPGTDEEIVMPIDVSLGMGGPLVVVPASDEPRTREHLGVHLPQLVEDARRALARIERRGREAADAERDPLTGVLNRRAYDRLAGRLRAGDALVLLDLDDFKAVNDTHGHLVGDQVLRSFGSVLRDQVRITEQPIRLGGDEFLVVLEEPGFDGCQRLLDRLRLAWREHRPLPVTFSAGTAVVTTNVEVALDTADRALYIQKRGRSEVGLGTGFDAAPPHPVDASPRQRLAPRAPEASPPTMQPGPMM
jgi:diguanylate cyclase (GGDEF)-like protein